jgi:polyphenol oxidase
MLFSNDSISIFFGDAQTAVYPERSRAAWQQAPHVLEDPSFIFLKQHFDRLDGLMFAHQVHGTQGLRVTRPAAQHAFTHEADFLYTNQPAFGIGVLTADCVPLVIYDPTNSAVALVHAGWRGAVHGVVRAACDALSTTYGTHLSDVQVIVGPAACSCCYVVGTDFIEMLTASSHYAHGAYTQRDGNVFFDIPLYIMNQLRDLDVPQHSICTTYAVCTICDTGFCSHRRDQESPLAGRRQMTVVVINL